MNDSKDSIVNLEVVPPGSSIPIEVTTDLYIRLQQLMLEGLPYKDMTHFVSCLKEAKAGTAVDPISYHLLSLLHLLNLIEISAKSKGLIKQQRFNLETKSVIED